MLEAIDIMIDSYKTKRDKVKEESKDFAIGSVKQSELVQEFHDYTQFLISLGSLRLIVKSKLITGENNEET